MRKVPTPSIAAVRSRVPVLVVWSTSSSSSSTPYSAAVSSSTPYSVEWTTLKVNYERDRPRAEKKNVLALHELLQVSLVAFSVTNHFSFYSCLTRVRSHYIFVQETLRCWAGDGPHWTKQGLSLLEMG